MINTHTTTTMEDLDEIWEYLETTRKIETPTKKVLASSQFFCECTGVKVLGPDNLPVCTKCGLVESSFIDESPEWTSGVSEDGVSKDPSRCGNLASDTELFSSAWGTGTVISTHNAPAYAMRRMARINFHSSMNHKDRSLFHAYKDIERAAKDILNLTDSIVRDAKVLYRKFNGEKLTRGAIRSGVKANCVMYACKLSNVPRTTKEIADAFDIPTRDISRTAQLFKETILGDTTPPPNKPSVTRSADVVHRLLNSFNLGGDRQVRIRCIKLCKKLDNCTTLMSKTPSSIASVVVLLSLGSLTTKQDVCEKCGISMPTLTKIEALAKAYLEETPE
jgi:transcription initiation factor TFIIIB Brf1 subunit/transcription initiation factor TFIIB